MSSLFACIHAKYRLLLDLPFGQVGDGLLGLASGGLDGRFPRVVVGGSAGAAA